MSHDHEHDHHDHEHHHHAEASEKEYGKLALVFLAIIFITFVLNLVIDGHGSFTKLPAFEALAAQFMGVFFIVFASFKLVNIKEFANGFRTYDLVAKKYPKYARLYPFLQLALGLLMFIRPWDSVLQAVAFIVSVLALMGAANAVVHKEKIQCACLGNVIKMPLTTISIIEDGLMAVLSFYMLISIIAGM